MRSKRVWQRGDRGVWLLKTWVTAMVGFYLIIFAGLVIGLAVDAPPWLIAVIISVALFTFAMWLMVRLGRSLQAQREANAKKS